MRENRILYRSGLDPGAYLCSPADWLDRERCLNKLQELMHPQGLVCPDCRSSQRSLYGILGEGTQRYRCQNCGRTYNVLSGTIFHSCRFSPRQIVLFFWLIALGSTDAAIARALGCNAQTIKVMRAKVHAYREKSA